MRGAESWLGYNSTEHIHMLQLDFDFFVHIFSQLVHAGFSLDVARDTAQAESLPALFAFRVNFARRRP